MYNNRTNIKIKLDDKVLDKINQVDSVVESVDKLYDDFDKYEAHINKEMDDYEEKINDEIDTYEARVDDKIEDIDNRKQDTLIAGDYIRIEDSPEGPVISSIGGT